MNNVLIIFKDNNFEYIPLTSLFITLVILLILSAYFSGSETGLLSSNRYRMRVLADKGHRGSKESRKLAKTNGLNFSVNFTV